MSLFVGRSPAFGHQCPQLLLFLPSQSHTVFLDHHIQPTSRSSSFGSGFLHLTRHHFNDGRLLDWDGNYTVLTPPKAKELDIDTPSIWAYALECAGIENVLTEPGYDYHMAIGPFEQHVGVDFTAGLSPTGNDIIFEAQMYRANITRKAIHSFRNQPICHAIIAWQPKQSQTAEVVRRFLQEQHR